MSLDHGKWFEGYDAHEDVIIDDFREGWCPFPTLLRLLDRYPYRIEVKGASRQFLAKRIFITSCHPPDKVYNNIRDEDMLQLGRRIDMIYFMPSQGVILGCPGTEIGIEPSVEQKFPEHGPEQKVWGNTTEAPSPIAENEEGPPVLAHPQTDLPDDESELEPHTNPCGQDHDPAEFCIECECGVCVTDW
nr:MAG: rep protein [Cressdnaviricota sp.]